MIDYRQLQAFATVLECQSFDKAAQRLHLTQSAVSQRVKQLEERIGQLLIVRSQPLHPTPAGQQLLRHFHQIKLLQSELLDGLGDAYEQGYTRLSIGLNADSLETWFMEAIDPLLQQSPLLLDLRVDDQDQTHHFLRQGEVIGCISSSDQPIQGGSCVALGLTRYRALISTEFRDRYFADGVDTESLLRAPAVVFNQRDELQDRYLKTYFDFEGDYPRHLVPSSNAFVELIARGHGWGMVPDQQSQALLEQRRLVELVPEHCIDVPLYWHSWNLSTDTGRRLTEVMMAYCRAHLLPLPDTD
ncbi:LysR family transcriptional regulator ArgP [Motiliproteus sp.]|uniref:LysR family transcriptional regulator ArgP n=1 Tax=Motiliproteus sp. TaxID=1898955 RepID=UPI003BA9D3BC